MSKINEMRHEANHLTLQTLRKWSKSISRGEAMAVPVFAEGKWTLQVMRGNKRTMQVEVDL